MLLASRPLLSTMITAPPLIIHTISPDPASFTPSAHKICPSRPYGFEAVPTLHLVGEDLVEVLNGLVSLAKAKTPMGYLEK